VESEVAGKAGVAGKVCAILIGTFVEGEVPCRVGIGHSGFFLLQLPQEIADDPFGLQLFGLPELAEFLPGGFAAGEVFFSLPERDFAELEQVVAFLDPIGHEFPFFEELFALLLQTGPELFDFPALSEEGFLAFVIELGDASARLVDPFPRSGFTDGLRQLGGRFLDGDAHFQQLAMRPFEFQSEFFEPEVAGFEVLGVGGEHLVLALEFGLSEFVFACETALFQIKPFLYFVTVVEKGLAGLVERIPGPVEALFPLFEEFAETEHLVFLQFELLAFTEIAIRKSLLRDQEFALVLLHVVSHLVEMVELEADAVFEELAFLLQFFFKA